MKFLKRNVEKDFNNKLIAEIKNKYSISEDIVKLIMSKGYNTSQAINEYLQPQNFKFHNPFNLSGMKQAVEIINNAVSLRKKITILGDYDTDGICSTAILYKYFESVNIKVDYFLPNRFVDGYGLTMDTIDKIEKQFKPDLLITVDCGISSYKEIEYAKQKGIEVIVTDHHEIPPTLPNCVVIDPKIKDQKYEFSELCGAGVAFKLVQALKGYNFASQFLSIAAFATVADIVPLTNENRAIVYHGIKNYKQNLPKGVLKLIDRLKITNLQTSDISIRVAPKINAAGRMGDAGVAFRLFIEKSDQKINETIKQLEALNEVRVSDGDEIYQQALEMLSTQNVSNMKAIVLYKDEWNGGVLGIVCAKLVDKFNKPVCLLSRIENEYKGSVRSIEKIDIYKEISKLSDILIRFGGHSQAGGLSILEENLPEFIERLNNNLNESFTQKQFETVKYYDIDLNKTDLADNFLKQLSWLEPFGFGNEKPIFKLSFNNARIIRLKNYPQHLKIKFENLDIIAWNLGNEFEHLKTNSNKDVLVEFGTTYTYSGKEYVNATLKGIIIHKLNTNVKQNFVNASRVGQLKNLPDSVEIEPIYVEPEKVSQLIQNINNNSFGTLVVTHSFENYINFVNQHSKFLINYEMFEPHNKTGENTILYLPNFASNIAGFSNVIFLEPLLTNKAINNFSAENFYVVSSQHDNSKLLAGLDVSRNVFGQVHFALKNMIKHGIIGESEYDFYSKAIKINPQIKSVKFEQFMFVLLVLSELGILNVSNSDIFEIELTQVQNPLTNSKIYNFVNLFSKMR